MKKTVFAVGLATMFLSVSAAHAVGVSAEVGTTGIGAHLSIPVYENLTARVGVNAFNYSYSSSTSNVNYDFKLKLQTFDALADFYPFAGAGFRLTGGLVFNGNKIDATGKPSSSGTYTLNGNTYSSSTVGSLNGTVKYRTLAPYLGIGWGNAPASHSNLSFTTDLGVMFQGSGSSSLSTSNCSASAATCSQLSNDLAAENGKLDDKVSNYKMYPVIRVGVSYKF